MTRKQILFIAALGDTLVVGLLALGALGYAGDFTPGVRTVLGVFALVGGIFFASSLLLARAQLRRRHIPE